MSEKKLPKQSPVYIAKVGDTAAEIYLRQTMGGYQFYDFVLVRMYTTRTQRETKSESFFETSEENLIQAIKDAAKWIRETSHHNDSIEE